MSYLEQCKGPYSIIENPKRYETPNLNKDGRLYQVPGIKNQTPVRKCKDRLRQHPKRPGRSGMLRATYWYAVKLQLPSVVRFATVTCLSAIKYAFYKKKLEVKRYFYNCAHIMKFSSKHIKNIIKITVVFFFLYQFCWEYGCISRVLLCMYSYLLYLSVATTVQDQPRSLFDWAWRDLPFRAFRRSKPCHGRHRRSLQKQKQKRHQNSSPSQTG